MSNRRTKQFVKDYDALIRWIKDHAELCEEPEELRKIERVANRSGAFVNYLEKGSKER